MTAPAALSELRRLDGGLVVSCQAREDHPLHGPDSMAAMAEAAVQAGAVGIRAEGEFDIRAIAARVGDDVPIIGIIKTELDDGSLFITATSDDARRIVEAGARLVALDGTGRSRPGGDSLAAVIETIHAAGGAALADVARLDHAKRSIDLGADAVGTTLSGYSADSPKQAGPDLDLLKELVALEGVPAFGEGRFWTPEQVGRARALGASFVVVGTAITDPRAITARFLEAMQTS